VVVSTTMSSAPSGVLRSPSARGTSRNEGVQWDEVNLSQNEELKREAQYQKIEEASTPYMPPLDLSTIPDEDDEKEEGEEKEGHGGEDAGGAAACEQGAETAAARVGFAEANMSADDFQAAVAARLQEVANDTHDDDMDNDASDDALPERSSDYKDGIPFASKRQKHYDMKNALELGRQMLNDDEDDEDDDHDGDTRIERDMEALEERG